MEQDSTQVTTPQKDYYVVTRTLVGESAGVLTFTTFRDEAAFEAFRNSKMLDGSDEPVTAVYDFVAHGISYEEVRSLLDSPENQAATQVAQLRHAYGMLGEAEDQLDDLGDPTDPEVRAARERLVKIKRELDHLSPNPFGL